MPGPTAADLIFSSEQANHGFSRKLGDLKRSTLSIQNRLNSIVQDATFAQEVAQAYNRPLIANERCGSWYIDPRDKGGSAYFKSTDGHTGVWKFSLRRLNLHLLEIVGKHDGCIIVDSTRRGKRMPDALSKTVAIWCSVLNRFLFPADDQYHHLYIPPQVVSESEKAQITALLPSFLEALQSLQIQPETFRKNISKPLRPIWVTPESHLAPTSTIFEDFHPIICCTVSRRVAGGEVSEGGYIQGAGDDTENWAHGLSPILFWGNQQALLNTSESDLPELIEMLVRHTSPGGKQEHSLKCVKPTSFLFITELSEIVAKIENIEAETITIALWPDAPSRLSQVASTTKSLSSPCLDVDLGRDKAGAKNLRFRLPAIIDFVKKHLLPEVEVNIGENEDFGENIDVLDHESHSKLTSLADRKLVDVSMQGNQQRGDSSDISPPTLAQESEAIRQSLRSLTLSHPTASSSAMSSTMTVKIAPKKHIIIACETGRQASVGVGLAIVCLLFDDHGELLMRDSARRVMDKAFIASRLSWFSRSMPYANPSRDVLQSVRRFLYDYGT